MSGENSLNIPAGGAVETGGGKWGLNGSTLKLIAITAMLVDHIGAVLVEPFLWSSAGTPLYITYLVMRLAVGRIAFPIFCFLLVEGFQRTSNRKKYALRLGLFALIAEIPFDMAFNEGILEFTYQNVFFTLFWGFLAMWGLDLIWRNESWKKPVRILGCLLTAGAAMAAATVMATDYSGYGVACILVLYLFRSGRLPQVLAGTAVIWVGDLLCGLGGSEFLAPLGLILVCFYNGRRGLRLKYVFYLFYPVHLLILALIAYAMGLNVW